MDKRYCEERAGRLWRMFREVKRWRAIEDLRKKVRKGESEGKQRGRSASRCGAEDEAGSGRAGSSGE